MHQKWYFSKKKSLHNAGPISVWNHRRVCLTSVGKVNASMSYLAWYFLSVHQLAQFSSCYYSIHWVCPSKNIQIHRNTDQSSCSGFLVKNAQYTCQDSQSIKFRLQQWTGIPSASTQSKKNPYLLLHPEKGPLPLLLVVAEDHLS